MARSTGPKTNRTNGTQEKSASPAGSARKAERASTDGRSRRGWAEWFLHGPRVSDDFMTEREQPPAEEREPF